MSSLLQSPAALAAVVLFFLASPAFGQATGSIAGTVSLSSGDRLHKAVILLPQLNRRVETDGEGAFRIGNVPPGAYTLVVRAVGFGDHRRQVAVAAGQLATLNVQLALAVVREEITVTASGREETVQEAFQAVSTLNSIDLVHKAEASVGEVLDNEPGVSKRSFGPGSSRPVIRGFDGDRVLVMKDGVSTGALASQSGDHGEPINVLGLERLEVVKGPSTLLYGSSALGGVVNAITPNEHFLEHTHDGVTGFASGVGGSNNGMVGFGAGVQAGFGKWAVWANGGAQRTGDYDTPLGTIENSSTRSDDGTAGFGWLGPRAFFNLSGSYSDGRYGIPFAGSFSDEGAEEIDIKMRRFNTRFATGLRDLKSLVTDIRLTLDYTDYSHKELEIAGGTEEVGTRFDNKVFNLRGVFTQKQAGVLAGSFGFSAMARAYEAIGAEALSPAVDQASYAVFGLEQVNFERIGFQFGGRVETNRYDPDGAPSRNFTGGSGAAGVRVPLWKDGAFVANYTHSFRAPALEELYNLGPHLGNLAFEIGNTALKGERSNGIDLSLRHNSDRLRMETNVFYYGISNFVFLAPTGNLNEGLTEAEYLQGDSRFVGAEASAGFALHRSVWLDLGMDVVNAQLTSDVASSTTGASLASGTGLPRIPPVRGRASVEFRYRGWSVRPGVVVASAAENLFPTETRTAGYTLLNLDTTYTVAGKHAVHVFSAHAFNLGDRLYRNHLSFIKQLAPEMGRGVRFGYALRFF